MQGIHDGGLGQHLAECQNTAPHFSIGPAPTAFRVTLLIGLPTRNVQTMTDLSIIESIFTKAVEQPVDQRAAYLDEACPDEDVRREVERLLAAHPDAKNYLARPAVDADATIEPSAASERTQIGPYRLMEIIGEGGFGVVYVAEQQKPVRRKVALKVVKPGMDTKDVLARFEAEQQALALMDHPNVAKVLDAGTTEQGRPYFVMELVHGVKITEFCDTKRLSTKERLRLFMDVCHAVQHAHHKGIIHRDLKPNNILVTLHDGRPVPKVIDFGVAKALSQQLTEKTIYTSYGQMIGTPEYMSPEQAEMSGLGIDTRSDIYSLGVLLYELLVGQPPFEAQRLRASGFEGILRIIREEEPPRLSTKISSLGPQATAVAEKRGTDASRLRQSLEGELNWIVMKALDKDRNRRYETANGFALDVERFLKDDPVHACPPSTIYKLRKFARRNKGAVAVSLSLIAVMCLGLTGTSIGLVRVKVEAEKALDARNQADQARLRAVKAQEDAQSAELAERKTNMRMAFDRGVALCEDGHIGSGMLWLVGALDLASSEESAMNALIRRNLKAWGRELHTLKNVFPQDSCISTVAFGPREQLVFTGTTHGVVQIWDRYTGESIGTPMQHRGQMHEIPFSPDGKYFATASYDNTARLWQLNPRKPLHTFEHTDSVYGCLFTKDRRFVTSTSGGEILIWETQDQEWTESSKWIATPLPPIDTAVHDIALSPDGSQLVAAGHDGFVVVWDLDKREPVARFAGHQGGRVSTAEFLAPNRVASGDTAGNVHLWAWTEGTTVNAPGKRFGASFLHRGGVHRLRVSKDKKTILTSSFDNTSQRLDAATGLPIGNPFETGGSVHASVMSSEGRVLSCSGDGNAREIEPATGSLLNVIEHGPSTQPSIYSRDAAYVLIRYVDGSAKVFDSLTRKQLGMDIRPEGGVYSLAVNDDRSIVVTGGAQGLFQFWSTATGQPIGEKYKHGVGVWGLVFSKDGQWAYSAALDGVVKRWHAATGIPVEQPLLQLGGDSIRGMALSPDGSLLAVATSSRVTQVVETATGEIVKTYDGHKDLVMTAAYSPNGKLLATASFDNMAMIHNTETGQRIGPMPHRGPIWHCIAFNSAGTALATACEDRTVRVWDVATGKPIGPRLEHDGNLRALAFRNNDTQLITGTATGKTRVWDVTSQQLEGSTEDIRLQLAVTTGMELEFESGEIRVLDAETWKAKRQQLASAEAAP